MGKCVGNGFKSLFSCRSYTVLTSCRQPAPSEIPKGTRQVCLQRPFGCQGEAPNQLVKRFQMNNGHCFMLSGLPDTVLIQDIPGAIFHAAAPTGRLPWRRGRVWPGVPAGTVTTGLGWHHALWAMCRVRGLGKATDTHLGDCDPTVSRGHLCSKTSESFCGRFKGQRSPSPWISLNSGSTELDPRGPPARWLSARHPQSSQEQS